MCSNCKRRNTCKYPCDKVARLLPSMDKGKIQFNGRPFQHVLEEIYTCMIFTRRIIGARGVLKGRQKRVFDLHFNEALSQNKTARRMGISRRMVRDLFRKALGRIADHILENNFQHPDARVRI